MTTFHRNKIGSTTVTAARSAGAPSLTVADGSQMGSTFPVYVIVIRGSARLCVLEVTARAGNVLTVSGAVDGTTDAALLVGDVVRLGPTPAGVNELQDAHNALEATVAGLARVGNTAWASKLAGIDVDCDLATGKKLSNAAVAAADNSAALQAVLDTATAQAPLRLVIDGPLASRRLTIKSNTTLEFVAGGGFFHVSGDDADFLVNANRAETGAIVDHDIAIVGPGFVNLNGGTYPDGVSSTGAGKDRRGPAAGPWYVGLNLAGVRDLAIGGGIYLYDSPSYAIWIQNTDGHVLLDGGRIWGLSTPTGSGTSINTDGIHLSGGWGGRVTIHGWHLHSGDDAIAVNMEYPAQVATRGVGLAISDVHLDDCNGGIRVCVVEGAGATVFDRIAITNVTGSCRWYWLNVDDNTEFGATSSTGVGAVGSLVARNVAVTCSGDPTSPVGTQNVQVGARVDQLLLDGIAWDRPPAGYSYLRLLPSAAVDQLRLGLTIDRAAAAGAGDHAVLVLGYVDQLTLRIDHSQPSGLAVTTTPLVRIDPASAALGVNRLELSGVIDRVWRVVAHDAGTLNVVTSPGLVHANAGPNQFASGHYADGAMTVVPAAGLTIPIVHLSGYDGPQPFPLAGSGFGAVTVKHVTGTGRDGAGNPVPGIWVGKDFDPTMPVLLSGGSLFVGQNLANIQVWHDATPTSAFLLGYGLPAGASIHPGFGVYDGAAWINGMFVDKNTGAPILPACAAATAASGALFFDTSNSSKLTIKDLGGTTHTFY